MSPPTNVTEGRAFVGMTSYYRPFVPRHAEIAQPLTALTGKHAVFQWGQKEQEAFDTLKETLLTAPVLGYADPCKPYKLHTDASQTAVGAVLSQEDGGDKVIYYLSHKLTQAQQKWPTIEREMYAIIYAISKLRHFLLDASFTIYTDHKPLKHLFTSEMKNARVQRWAIMLDEYNCQIEYTSGKSNVTADLLSRLDTPAAEEDNDMEIEVVDSTLLQGIDRLTELDKIKNVDVESIDPLVNLKCATNLATQQLQDSFLQDVIKEITNGNTFAKDIKEYVLQDNLLYHI
jgi:hypothetical protein